MTGGSVSIFLPTRKGSQRVKSKNIRPFANIRGGLIELKLKQLLEISSINEIVLSTNDEQCMAIARPYAIDNDRLKIIKRPEHLAANDTNLSDLIAYAGSVCNSDHILWTHVTSPFVQSVNYEKAIEQYFHNIINGYDSLMSVKIFKNYLWSSEDNDIVNRVGTLKWPQTQDLKELHEITNAVFIANRNTYIELIDRIGNSPMLYIQNQKEAFDIDWEDDFTLAEYIYKEDNKVG